MSLNFQPQDNMNVHFQFMTVEIIVAFGYFMITLLQFVFIFPRIWWEFCLYKC